MEHFDRQPPRFVPTLTDVVPEGLPLQKAAQPQEPVLDAWIDPHDQTGEVPEHAPAAPPQHAPLSAEPTLEPFPSAPVAGVDAVPSTTPAPESLDPVWDNPDADAAVAHWSEALWAAQPAAQAPEAAVSQDWEPAALHELLVERILARLQPQLEAQLREAVADVVSMHAQAMARSLHGAVEDVVQHAVADAIAQEQIQAQLDLNAH